MNDSSNITAAEAIILPQPYLLFLGDNMEPGYAKTATDLRDWARDRCLGESALDERAGQCRWLRGNATQPLDGLALNAAVE